MRCTWLLATCLAVLVAHTSAFDAAAGAVGRVRARSLRRSSKSTALCQPAPRHTAAAAPAVVGYSATVRGGGGARFSSPDEDLGALAEAVAAQAPKGTTALEKVEHAVGALSTGLSPLWRITKLLFGVSILFYGMQFKTIALHVIIFRISGYRDVLEHMETLGKHYRKVREATEIARRSTKDIKVTLEQQRERKAAREAMLREREEMLRDGKITVEEARLFIEKYKEEIDLMVAQQATLRASSSSVVALKEAISWKAIFKTIRKLYDASIASITASTFEAAGRFTMAMYCGDALREDMRTLFGPSIDPLAFEIAGLDQNAEAVLTQPAVARAAFLGIFATAALLVCFYEEPAWALKVSLCYLGSGVVVGYLKSVINPFLEKRGKRIRPHLWVMIHFAIAGVGWRWHNPNCPALRMACLPFIHLLEAANNFLNQWSASAVSYMRHEKDVLQHAVHDGLEYVVEHVPHPHHVPGKLGGNL